MQRNGKGQNFEARYDKHPVVLPSMPPIIALFTILSISWKYTKSLIRPLWKKIIKGHEILINHQFLTHTGH